MGNTLGSIEAPSPAVNYHHEKCHWVDDEERKHCVACAERFTLTRRRHHCRACGDLFCSECCQAPSEPLKERTCRACTKTLSAQSRHAMSPMMLPSPSPSSSMHSIRDDYSARSSSCSDSYSSAATHHAHFSVRIDGKLQSYHA
ncbi:Lateral signaling target protein 2-like protein [Diplonema papillatum]|nr:Lateral signaling target protein 2-like protein [Diplonema papillatum]